MNTPLTLTEVMNLLGADNLSTKAPNGKTLAWLAPVSFDADGHPIIANDEKHTHGDLYDLLLGAGKELATEHDALAFWTCGWASPVTDDEHPELPPSLHPKRKRVSMLCLVTKNGDFGSALQMYGNPEQTEMIIGDNEGSGQLRDVALTLWD